MMDFAMVHRPPPSFTHEWQPFRVAATTQHKTISLKHILLQCIEVGCWKYFINQPKECFIGAVVPHMHRISLGTGTGWADRRRSGRTVKSVLIYMYFPDHAIDWEHLLGNLMFGGFRTTYRHYSRLGRLFNEADFCADFTPPRRWPPSRKNLSIWRHRVWCVDQRSIGGKKQKDTERWVNHKIPWVVMMCNNNNRMGDDDIIIIINVIYILS